MRFRLDGNLHGDGTFTSYHAAGRSDRQPGGCGLHGKGKRVRPQVRHRERLRFGRKRSARRTTGNKSARRLNLEGRGRLERFDGGLANKPDVTSEGAHAQPAFGEGFPQGNFVRAAIIDIVSQQDGVARLNEIGIGR